MKPLSHFLFVLIMLFAGMVQAQSDQDVLVWRIQGNALYMERPGAAQTPLKLGQSMGLDAVVSLKSGASVTLLYEDERIYLDEVGNYPLKSLVAREKEKSTSFMKRFFSYIYDGIVNTSGAKEIEKYHKEYLTQSSGGIKGFAGSEYGIQPSQAILGTFSPAPVYFEWFSCGDSMLYDFQIMDYQTDGLIFKALLRDTAIVVNMFQLAVDPGRKYYWVVYQKPLGSVGIGFNLVDDPSIRSPKMEFILSDVQTADLGKDLKASADYKNATEVDQLLMMAHELEEQGYIYASNLVLCDALKKDAQDPLLRRIYGAFLIRQGLWKTAQDYLSL